MTAMLIHENEDIFPEPKTFRPERWLSPSPPTKYLVSFSRGTRACVGINLSYAEMYLILASVYRRFEFDVSRVSRERDVEVHRDVIMAVARADSEGIVVGVKEITD